MSQTTFIDVFNGDADGICSLHQLRLAEPRGEARLVSGVKRDIRLLDRLAADPTVNNCRITVLDISLDSNRDSLHVLLGRGNQVTYVDHHFCGDIPVSSLLETCIDPASDVCTGLLVDRLLHGRFRSWAVVAAFGDNLHAAANLAAVPLALGSEELGLLRELGELMNYNGYGAEPSDLHLRPEELYGALRPYADPMEFIRHSAHLAVLRRGYAEDMEFARSIPVLAENDGGRIYRFPNASWARRVAGVFSNEKAREREDKAHALLVATGDDTFMVSVRAPLSKKTGAAALCRRFDTGGGREAAAGINVLPAAQVESFVAAFQGHW